MKIGNLKLKILLPVLLVFISVFLIFGLWSLVSAQGGAISPTIGVSPAKFFESITPGEPKTFKVKLRNLGTDPLPLAASVTDIDDINDDGIPIFAEETSRRSASDWLKLAESDLIISPGEVREISFTITAPETTAPGGYTAAIIFQAQLPSYYFDLDASTRILPAISVLGFFTVTGVGEITVDQVELGRVRVAPIVISSPISMVAEVSNRSNFFVQTDTEATVKNLLTKTSFNHKLGTVILLPEKNRKFVTAFENQLLPGLYSAAISFKQGDKILVGSVKFVSLPWYFIILVLLAALVGISLALRRRLGRAWLVLRGREVDSPRPKRPTIR